MRSLTDTSVPRRLSRLLQVVVNKADGKLKQAATATRAEYKSVLQLMRPFTQTGALIQTIIEIIKDIRGFWYICTVILVGFTCAFTVCEPQVPAFTMKDARVGPFYPLIEVVISMIGAFR